MTCFCDVIVDLLFQKARCVEFLKSRKLSPSQPHVKRRRRHRMMHESNDEVASVR